MSTEMQSSGRRWAWGYALFLALLTTLPYALAFARAGEAWTFSGFLFGVDDGNSYIAKMLSGSSGAWSFRTPYTTHPQNGLLFLFWPYLVLGKLASPPELHLQLVLIFQIFRMVGVVMVVHAGFDFIAFFEPRPMFQRLGTVLLTVGGGLGWLLTLIGRGDWLGSLPLDVYSPETFGFLAVFGLPHLAVGRAFMLWGLLAFLKTPNEMGVLRRGLKTGFLWLAAGLFSPINPAIAWLITALFLGLTALGGRDASWGNRVKTAVTGGLISLPVVGYNLVASNMDPFFRDWTAQNLILSPNPLHYLAAFGLYLPWVILGARRMWSDRSPINVFPIMWAALIPVLAYLPVNLQRRLPEAAFAAVVVLFVRGIEMREDYSRPRPLGIFPALPLVLTSLLLFAGSLTAAWSPAPPVFRSAAEMKAIEVLGAEVEKNAVVLAPKEIGNVLPAFLPVRVVIGHGPETINFDEIRPRVEAYFAGVLTAEEQAALIEEYRVDYVVGSGSDVSTPPGGVRIFEDQGYFIERIP